MIHTSWSDIKASRWALTRRASRWPLIRLVGVVFVLGVCFGVALSFAGSVLSSENVGAVVDTAGRHMADSSSHTDGSAVRASQPEATSALGRADVSTASPATAALARTTPKSRGSSLENTPAVIEPIAQPTDQPSQFVRDIELSVDIPQKLGSVEQIIRAAALRHGVDPDVMVRVARCESGPTIDVNAIGDGGLALGPFQFHAESWMFLVRASGLPYTLREIGHVEAQAEVASWAFANGYASWWTCR